MNLVENKYNLNSYYCTWASQSDLNDILKNTLDSFSSSTRDYLNEETVFGENGLVHQYPEIREKLIFIFDDGWDVPYGLKNNENNDFGSLIVNEERFPSCSGEPKERLKKLVDKVKAYGWKGVGIWICASAKGEHWSNVLSPEETDKYWRERFEWSKYAGISYWKVDWGNRCGDNNFRRVLNNIKDEVYPELVIEHAVCCGPLSGIGGGTNHDQSGRYGDWDTIPQRMAQLTEFSDVIRSYDVSTQLSIPTTIDRVQYILRIGNAFNSKALLNAEDEAYVCAALSLEIGVMTNQLRRQNGSLVRVKTTEPIRAVNWLSSFAPPLAIGECDVNFSSNILFDYCNFVNLKTWVSRYGDRVIPQGAPSITTRNDNLPNVEYLENEKPYIVSTRHTNGAYAIAVLPRFVQEAEKTRFFTPKVNLNITQKVDLPIGIFGEVNEVNVEFDCSIEGKKVFAQDLASDEAVDITNECVVDGVNLKINGELISKIGTSKNCAGDESKPGLVIKLV